MDSEVEPVFEQRLQHGTVHLGNCGTVGGFRGDVEGVGVQPSRASENLNTLGILADAIGEHTVGCLDEFAHREAAYLQPAAFGGSVPTASTGAVGVGLDGGGFEGGMCRGLAEGVQGEDEGTYGEVGTPYDMSHNDMLNDRRTVVKENRRRPVSWRYPRGNSQ